jgi:hypothetical protein
MAAADVHGHVLDGGRVGRVAGPVDELPVDQGGRVHLGPVGVLVGCHPGRVGAGRRLPGLHDQPGAVVCGWARPDPEVGQPDASHGVVHSHVAWSLGGVEQAEHGGSWPTALHVAVVGNLPLVVGGDSDPDDWRPEALTGQGAVVGGADEGPHHPGGGDQAVRAGVLVGRYPGRSQAQGGGR